CAWNHPDKELSGEEEGGYGECNKNNPSSTEPDDFVSSLQAAAAQTTAELMVHPLLLNIHPPPERVAISHADDPLLLKALLREIAKHRHVEEVVVVVDEVPRYQEEALWTCQEAADTAQLLDIHCLDLSKRRIAEMRFLVDAVILPYSYTVLGAAEEDPPSYKEQKAAMRYWYEHLSGDGALMTPLGNTFSLERIMFRVDYNEEDVEEEIDEEEEETPEEGAPVYVEMRSKRIKAMTKADFARIIDFDIPSSYYFYSAHHNTPGRRTTTSSTPINMGVAFKESHGVAYWRRNEANYNRLMKERLRGIYNSNDFAVFDSATMLQLQFPPSHSAMEYCGCYSPEVIEKRECTVQGYHPDDPNIPLDDLYVSKSKAGENAGRGVFANVDITEGSNIALETTTDSIHFEWMTTQLHRDMMESVPIYAKGFAKIVHVYAEAYGYESNPWGRSQESVMSHFLTFVNHGCNGTANLGERGMDPGKFTEWSVDVEEAIPKEMRTEVIEVYNPNVDRSTMKYATNCVAGKNITKGEELYDNYMNYGGDEFFAEMVLSLRNECSGGLGLVEQYQSNQKGATGRLHGIDWDDDDDKDPSDDSDSDDEEDSDD
ncbi:MAG: hypothetical protein SGILL_009125, partial [Bacillariaceae sp.]